MSPEILGTLCKKSHFVRFCKTLTPSSAHGIVFQYKCVKQPNLINCLSDDLTEDERQAVDRSIKQMTYEDLIALDKAHERGICKCEAFNTTYKCIWIMMGMY